MDYSTEEKKQSRCPLVKLRDEYGTSYHKETCLLTQTHLIWTKIKHFFHHSHRCRAGFLTAGPSTWQASRLNDE